jgi:hypothetical protein
MSRRGVQGEWAELNDGVSRRIAGNFQELLG